MELEEMLATSREQVRSLAPKTVVWAAGGTRRQAALQGIPIDQAYYDWAWQQQINGIALFFELGVQTLFAPVLGPPQVREVGPYRAAIATALARTGDAASMETYERMGVRVRFYGQQRIPGLPEVCARVEQATAHLGPQTLWWSMVVENDEEALWDALQAAMRVNAASLNEAIQAFYGEPVQPVDVFIGFGKCQAGYLLPPLLSEHAHLYWTAFPSYMINEEHLRTIFWDYQFARATWSADKTNRYNDMDSAHLAELYTEPLILGVGQRIGRFWHPSFPARR